MRIFAFVDAQKADFPVRTHVVAANREIVESAIDSRWHPDGWHVSAESYGRSFLRVGRCRLEGPAILPYRGGARSPEPSAPAGHNWTCGPQFRLRSG